MPELITWVKPSDTEIVTNSLDETIAHAQSLGWRRADAPKAAADITRNDPVVGTTAKKRGRPPKAKA